MVPVVDLRAPSVADDVGRACEEIGFFTLVGHGVEPGLVEWIDEVSRAFFDLPLDEKLALRDGGPAALVATGGRVGRSVQTDARAEPARPEAGIASDALVPDRPIYRPIRSESLGATSGGARHGDLKESLDYGPTLPGVAWPERPPQLERAYRGYLAAMNRLAGQLRRTIAGALGREDGFFEPLFDDRASSLRVINYPALEARPREGELRAGAHRDYGFLTILRSENVAGGLEVRPRDGEWVPVETPPGGFVVNLGDMLAEWTEGRLVSTLHRVGVPPSDATNARRQSLVFFHNPRADAYIDTLGTTAGEYILRKADLAFGTAP